MGVGCSGNRRYFYPHVYFRGQFSISLFGPSIYDRHNHCPIGRLAPTVVISNPTNGSVLAAPATLALTATASDSDGSVTNVQFFQGTTSLGNLANSPYSVTVRDLAAGNYALSAVAADNAGAKVTNSVMVRVVNPAPTTLSAAQLLSPTSF